MTDDMQAIRDDIAYLKALAEGGQDGANRGGWIMVAAGGLYGLASLVQWAALAQVAPIGMAVVNWTWLAALIGFFIVLFLTKMRQRTSGERSAVANLVWAGIGWGLFIIFAAIAIATWRTHSVLLISFSPTIVLTLYGAAWMVAAMVSRKLWYWLQTVGCFAGALIAAWLVGDTLQWLFYAVALFLLAFLPGLISVLGARQEAAGE